MEAKMTMSMKMILIQLVAILFLTFCKNVRPKEILTMQPAIAISEADGDTVKGSFERRNLQVDVFFEMSDLSETTYSIKWGRHDKQVYRSKQVFEILGSGTLEYLTSNDSVIVLAQSCGTSCLYFVMLPMNGGEPLLYYHPQAMDLDRNLIAYCPIDYEDNIFLIVENYLTKQQILLRDENMCPALFKGDCIEVCYFDDGELVLKWQGSNWKSSNLPDMQAKRIPITN